MNPKTWTEVYASGTKAGEEEAKFFKALARDPRYNWRSSPAIAKEAGLSAERVDEIIDKYARKISPSLVYPHPTNDDHWGYWEGLPEKVYKKDPRSLASKDKDRRVEEHLTDKIDLTAKL